MGISPNLRENSGGRKYGRYETKQYPFMGCNEASFTMLLVTVKTFPSVVKLPCSKRLLSRDAAGVRFLKEFYGLQ